MINDDIIEIEDESVVDQIGVDVYYEGNHPWLINTRGKAFCHKSGNWIFFPSEGKGKDEPFKVNYKSLGFHYN